MLRGNELINDIDACTVGPGQVAAWWLGQMGFVFKTPAGVLYLDAFLSMLPDRAVPPLLKPSEATNADWIAGTHDHADHIDRGAWPEMATASPKAKFIVPDLLLAGVANDLKIPAERFIGMDEGKTIRLAPNLAITAIASAHEFLDQDQASGKFPHLGYVVQSDGCTFYHSGDCCVYEGLLSKVRSFSPRAMFLPINGRDARRLAANCIGNMTYQEAADLAGWAACPLVVPAHYDMFAFNLGPVGEFVDYVHVKYPAMRAIVPNYGERFWL